MQTVTIGNLTFSFGWTAAVSFAIATVTVWLLIYGRHEIRLRRLGLLRDYLKAYPHTSSNVDTPLESGSDDADPSFEYAKSKYSSDLRRPTDGNTPQARMHEIETAMKRAYFFRGGTPRILFAALGYWAIVFFGFRLALDVPSCTAAAGQCSPFLNLFLTGGIAKSNVSAPTQEAIWAATNAATIASFAFVGAYAASLRYMLRSLATFDLTAFTFIRQAATIVITMLVVVAMYRAVPDPTLGVSAIFMPPTTAPTQNPGVSYTWLLLALAFGLLPGSVFQFVMTRTGSYINWTKSSDDRFLEWTRVVPLDVIDGIDYFTRFRLEECGISDVQALATYNPIMLHIETPYRIYQALDWITQAQLCCVVGLDRFLLLRQFNIRTIFDLERALKGDRTSDPIRKAALDKFDQIYAGILFSPNNAMRNVEGISKATFFIRVDKAVEEVSAGRYSKWAHEQICLDPVTTSFAIEHLMNWISDDLHVRRARRIWNEISQQLGPSSLTLYDDSFIRNASKPKTDKEGDADGKEKEQDDKP